MIKIILLTLLLSTSVHAGFFMNALESVRDVGVAVSGALVDGYYGIVYSGLLTAQSKVSLKKFA
jgi:hypothetical protein